MTQEVQVVVAAFQVTVQQGRVVIQILELVVLEHHLIQMVMKAGNDLAIFGKAQIEGTERLDYGVLTSPATEIFNRPSVYTRSLLTERGYVLAAALNRQHESCALLKTRCGVGIPRF